MDKPNLKVPIVLSLLTLTGTYFAYKLLPGGTEEQGAGGKLSKEATMAQVKNELKKELKLTFPINVPRDQDGLPTKEFFIKIHTIIYKYKKYGHDMIAEANTAERINILEQIEELKEQVADQAPPQQQVIGMATTGLSEQQRQI